MGFLSKEDFGDNLSKYKALSGMDCLALVAAKAWEKEQRGKSKVVDEPQELFRVRVRGFLFQEPKINISMQEKTTIPSQRNKGKGLVVQRTKRAQNDDDYEPGPSNDRVMQPKQKARRPQYHHADVKGTVMQEKTHIPYQFNSKPKPIEYKHCNDDEAGPSRKRVKPPRLSDDDDDEEEFKLSRKRVKSQKRRRTYVKSRIQPQNLVKVELPERVRERIEEIGGSELQFVTEKRVTATDLAHHENRFNMPENTCAVDLLQLVGGRNVRVDVIQPDDLLTVRRLNFTKWTNDWFIFNGTWHNFAISGNLHTNDLVHVWTFRLPNQRQGFAIVKV